jgi:AcrR family transcriptional regulator
MRILEKNPAAKQSFKQQSLKLREDAVLDATHRLLAIKGFDLMTMDDVAGEVGIAKPSLYKHFASKEELVGAAMSRLIDNVMAFLATLAPAMSPVGKLRAILEWALRTRLAGGLPYLPSTSAHVREMLLQNADYVSKVLAFNTEIAAIVARGKELGELRDDLPDEVILFSFYARSCDPTVEYLKLYAQHDDDAIVKHMLSVCFDGLAKVKKPAFTMFVEA